MLERWAAGGDKTYVFIVDELSIKTQSGKELLQNGNMEKASYASAC